jgi:acyl carrier protein
MVPAAYTEIASVPLTPNGKTDRTALPDPDQPSLGPASPYVPPRTPTQERLAQVWAEVLGAPAPGINDNLFDLGANSLLVNKAVVRIRAEFDVDVPIAAIFERPTIAEIAEAIDGYTEVEI